MSKSSFLRTRASEYSLRHAKPVEEFVSRQELKFKICDACNSPFHLRCRLNIHGVDAVNLYGQLAQHILELADTSLNLSLKLLCCS